MRSETFWSQWDMFFDFFTTKSLFFPDYQRQSAFNRFKSCLPYFICYERSLRIARELHPSRKWAMNVICFAKNMLHDRNRWGQYVIHITDSLICVMGKLQCSTWCQVELGWFDEGEQWEPVANKWSPHSIKEFYCTQAVSIYPLSNNKKQPYYTARSKMIPGIVLHKIT